MTNFLSTLLVWDTVYAQGVDKATVAQKAKESYGSFYNSVDDSWYAMCTESPSVNVAPFVECSKISIEKLSKELCKNDKTTNTNKQAVRNVTALKCECGAWYKLQGSACVCQNGTVTDKDSAWNPVDACIVGASDSLGIKCDVKQLMNGTCTRNINQTLGIRSSDTTPNPTVMLQDIVLSATSFVGTLIMIALIVMGVKYIKWWYDEGATGDLKWNVRKLLIWLWLIIGSYTIIRIVQYVARGY
jgi:hypothetical protein